MRKTAIDIDDPVIDTVRTVQDLDSFKNFPDSSRKLMIELLSEGKLSEAEIKAIPDDFSELDMRTYSDRHFSSWRSKTWEHPDENNKLTGGKHYDIAEAINEAKNSGQDATQCDELLKYFMELTRYPIPTEYYPPQVTLRNGSLYLVNIISHWTHHLTKTQAPPAI